MENAAAKSQLPKKSSMWFKLLIAETPKVIEKEQN